jgi:hypothetical protein
MTGCISPAAAVLERAIALVHLTQGRVGEDHLVSARQKHAAASMLVRTNSSSESPTTVSSGPPSCVRPRVRVRMWSGLSLDSFSRRVASV